MSRQLYAFGSLCRGEIDHLSDIDLLACVGLDRDVQGIDRNRFSIYTRERLKQLWSEGNPFAWHLHLESRLVYSSDGTDFIKHLGKPREYSKASEDCAKFKRLFDESLASMSETIDSQTFHISCIFLAARNFATCYSFQQGRPVFSRLSPLLIRNPAPITQEVFEILVRARVLSTRGLGTPLSKDEIEIAKACCPSIRSWMSKIAPIEVPT